MLRSPTSLSTLLAILVTASSVALAAPSFSGDKSAHAFELLRRQGSTVISSCTQPNTAALTFDDGPYIYESDIVDTLNNAGIKGTFFINGNNWECIYQSSAIASIQKVYNSGHQIGSHTWRHLDLSTLTASDLSYQFDQTNIALQRILGVSPRFFRPPYGTYNDAVVQAATSRNLITITWDFDSGDSTGASVQQSENLYQTTAGQHPNNVLALNHETYSTTAYQVLPYAIQTLKAAGYNLVTVAECLGYTSSDFYWNITSPGTPDSTWVCQ